MSTSRQFVNDPGTTLAAAVTSTTATTITVASSAGYPSGPCDFTVGCDTELMQVTNISGTTWTVTRGAEGTTAATHLINSNVNATLTKQSLLEGIGQSNWNLLDPDDRMRVGGVMKLIVGKNESVTSGGGTFTCLNYTAGPGYLTDFWIATNLGSGNSNKADIAITIDGSVLYTGSLQMFMASPFFTDALGGQVFSNDFMRQWGGSKTMIPIPFQSSIEIVITNNDISTLQIWFQGGYITGIVPNNWRRSNKLNIVSAGPGFSSDTSVSLTQDQSATILDQSGLPPGRLLGMYLLFNGTGANNRYFLEGNIQIYLDGVLAYQTSGIEDYISASDYFILISAGHGDRFATLQMKQDSSPFFYGMMRFHIQEPMLFNGAVKVVVQMGDSVGSGGATFTGAVLLGYTIWFYTE
jgi:hypothetical protein